jgi:hypothetical protein
MKAILLSFACFYLRGVRALVAFCPGLGLVRPAAEWDGVGSTGLLGG